MEPQDNPTYSPIISWRGVGPHVEGWLLFYCISRTILSPSYLLLTIHNMHPLFLILLNVTAAIVGLIAGASVWRRSSTALRIVAIDLVFRLIMLVAVATWQLASHRSLRSVLTVGAWALAFVLAWFLYFRTSKRVLLTLGRNL